MLNVCSLVKTQLNSSNDKTIAVSSLWYAERSRATSKLIGFQYQRRTDVILILKPFCCAMSIQLLHLLASTKQTIFFAIENLKTIRFSLWNYGIIIYAEPKHYSNVFVSLQNIKMFVKISTSKSTMKNINVYTYLHVTALRERTVK